MISLLFSFLSLLGPLLVLSQSNLITLSYGTFQGLSSQGLDTFLGIPFATAERFGLPRPPSYISGVQNATAFGPACPQQVVNIPGIFEIPPLNTSEECLFVNIIRPSNISQHSKLPVLFWIFGGDFVEGDTSQYNGSPVVARSIALGEPVIYVSANYRLNAFGFLASKEVKKAGLGNLGLRDQRFALQWVQENIALFGGDPSKVTIWGISAGAISVGLHMVINSGDQDGLFRGAVMESGSPPPLSDISGGQPFYDQLVANTNCTYSADTFACLKAAPFEKLQITVSESPNFESFTSLQTPWQPRVDGIILPENPQNSIARGAYARIPMITGDCDDEGTIFSFSTLNLTTDQEAVDYLHENYFTSASDEQFQAVADLYPSDPTQGSPFDTGTSNQLSPEYKRIAAFQGDLAYQAPRRFFLQAASKTQDTWSFLYKRGKNTPAVGSFHTSDLPEFYASAAAPDFQGTDALVEFANRLDPNLSSDTMKKNLSTLIHWPKYSTNHTSPPLLTFLDPNSLSISPDTFRAAPIEALIKVLRMFP